MTKCRWLGSYKVNQKPILSNAIDFQIYWTWKIQLLSFCGTEMKEFVPIWIGDMKECWNKYFNASFLIFKFLFFPIDIIE